MQYCLIIKQTKEVRSSGIFYAFHTFRGIKFSKTGCPWVYLNFETAIFWIYTPPGMPGRQNESVDLGIFVSMFLCKNPGSAPFLGAGWTQGIYLKTHVAKQPSKNTKTRWFKAWPFKKTQTSCRSRFCQLQGFFFVKSPSQKKVTSGIARRNMERLVCWLGLGWLLLCSPPPCPTSFVGKMGWRWSGTLMWTWQTHTHRAFVRYRNCVCVCACVFLKDYTFTESSSLYLKIDAWNTIVSFWPVFRGYVSFRECISVYCTFFRIEHVLIPYLGEWLIVFHQPLHVHPSMCGHVGKDSLCPRKNTKTLFGGHRAPLVPSYPACKDGFSISMWNAVRAKNIPLSSHQNPYNIPLYWLFNRDPYKCLL